MNAGAGSVNAGAGRRGGGGWDAAAGFSRPCCQRSGAGLRCATTAPSDADAAALSLMINSTGNVNVRLKPLMSVEDIDEAFKKTPTYRAPGQ